ncbi:hypothetical protein AB0F57_34210, partial [Streptomyces tanashiensis]
MGMFEKWRGRKAADAGAPARDAAPVAPATATGDAWLGLPPVRRVLDGAPRTITEHGFAASLATHWNPSFQSDLGHGAVPDAPGGVLLDAVRTVREPAGPPAAELPGLRLPVAGTVPSTPSAVQRAINAEAPGGRSASPSGRGQGEPGAPARADGPVRGRGDAATPVRGEVPAPVRGVASAPAGNDAAPTVRAAVPSPVRKEAATPARAEVPAPVRGKAAAPVRGEASAPAGNDAAPTVRAAVPSPVRKEAATPARAE